MAVPPEHPIRKIKPLVDAILRDMNELFDDMYAKEGRPSIPPERLLKAQVLIALFSVRSRRLFVEQLQYNLLFRWFLDMDLSEETFDNSTFSKNQDRLLKHHVAKVFFEAVVERAQLEKYVSSDHFTVDGTLIEAWASLKSFRPKDQDVPPPGPDRNGFTDFHGEKRSNKTHESTTDPEAVLCKKGKGKEAKLAFGAHALMENRNGLCVDLQIKRGNVTETKAALEMIEDQKQKRGIVPATIGADKGYHNREFVSGCRAEGIVPHVAPVKNRKVEQMDGRTIGSRGYVTSQRIRKRVEEIFGWAKTVGCFRKTRFLGVERTQLAAYFVAASYNLVRLAKLMAGPPGTKQPA